MSHPMADFIRSEIESKTEYRSYLLTRLGGRHLDGTLTRADMPLVERVREVEQSIAKHEDMLSKLV